MNAMKRAYSVLEIKEVDSDSRTITGLATTPGTDRAGDIVKPEGAKFNLPLPLLWQHMSGKPIGHVIEAKVTKKGIEIVAQVAKGVTADIEEAWSLIKSGLVRGLSIGFRGIDTEQIPNSWGMIYNQWEWLELSAVTIPANAEATIQTVKQFDKGVPAASGNGVSLTNKSLPASGQSSHIILKGSPMKNIGAQIAALKDARKEKFARVSEIQTKAQEENRSKSDDEQGEFDTLKTEIGKLDKEVADLEFLENGIAPTASPVVKDDAATRAPRVAAQPKKEAAPGVRFAQLMKVKAISRMDIVPQVQVAEKMYGRESEIFAVVKANEVAPGTNTSGNWAADLVSSEGAIAADFAEFLRPATILGKFGMDGIPSLRMVPFRRPLVLQTGGGAGYWVGEAKPKPLTSFDFDRSTLDPLKCANIVVLSKENIRDSSPSSDLIVRDEMRRALALLQDEAFIDPTNTGSVGVKPASILNGAETIVSETYSDETDVILDVRSLLQKFIDANNPANQAVLVMQEGTALAASLILNALGQRAFPELSMRGGLLLGIPVVTSESVPSGVVAILNASDVLVADDGDVTVDMSTEASLEMKSATFTQNPEAPGTGSSLVSLWQNNLVGFLAERTVNWKRRRTSAAAYLTGVAWGGAVNIS